MNIWTRELPTTPGIYDHRNLENARGRAPIRERVVFVGYVNWNEDKALGHGTKPTQFMPPKLRACRLEHPMTTDSLTVQEWGGQWRRMDRSAAALAGNGSGQAQVSSMDADRGGERVGEVQRGE